MAYDRDIIVFGGGVAGLFTAARIRRAGYDVILVEKDALGGTQTLASQGMIHGGQKYTLAGKATGAAAAAAAMPERWEACFAGTGELDLSAVKTLSGRQVMFPAGSFFANLFSRLTVFAAAKAVNGKTRKLERDAFPVVLKRDPVYEMQECVLDVKSLVAALAGNLEGRIFKGEATALSSGGRVTIGGKPFSAKTVIFAAGAGNETALKLLGADARRAQRRPLRQIMVRPMRQALYGHGITGEPKPRVTVTSHPDGTGNYIWYLGGNVAERGAKMTEDEALAFVKNEMRDIFPDIDWNDKQWASHAVDRAEAFSDGTQLAAGPQIQRYGSVLVAWPTKLTFAPLLADLVLAHVEENGRAPTPAAPPPDLPAVVIGAYPWEDATWRRL
ncbi:MAG: FAD-dependent oxidoreductase [Alphaproteobacteria bacterium]|nr:FAD-dependent oxidoreductase [Alphaproteobacteria bacterium]